MKTNKGCVATVVLPFYIEKYLKAKEELLRKLKSFFHHAKIYLIFKKSSKKTTKILQDSISL